MFLVRRLVQSVLALWLASIIVFAGARSLPGDPAIALSTLALRGDAAGYILINLVVDGLYARLDPRIRRA